MRSRGYLPFLLAAVLLFLAGRQLQKSYQGFSASDVSDDAASSWDEHMRSVAAALPSDVATVGYLESSDLDPSIRGRDEAEFYLTQYGLAPRVVQVGHDYDWIVGYFGEIPPREIRRALDQKLGAYSIQGFGSRIYLIQRLRR